MYVIYVKLRETALKSYQESETRAEFFEVIAAASYILLLHAIELHGCPKTIKNTEKSYTFECG